MGTVVELMAIGGSVLSIEATNTLGQFRISSLIMVTFVDPVSNDGRISMLSMKNSARGSI